MAVTVTNANPSGSTDKSLMGSYGPLSGGVSVAVSDVAKGKRVRVAKLNLSGTYATNGFALTPSAYGLKEIHSLAVIADGTSGAAATPYLSTTGGSPIVKLVTDNVPTELANTTAVTNFSYTVLLIGV